MFTVTVVPEGITFAVRPGEDILRAGRRQGVWFPFECGWGSCATCKAILVEGQVEVLFPEAPALSERDHRRKRIVLCQSTPVTDVSIRPVSVSTEPSSVRPTCDREATLVGWEELGPEIRRFIFEVDGPVSYRAGQYAILDLGAGLRRCFSMASLPTDRRLQFVAKRYSGGAGSNALFELAPSSRIGISLPFGDMWLREGARPVVLIAGGTGISAILALAAHGAALQDRRRVWAFYGAATHAELVLAEELRKHVESVPGGRVHFVLESPPRDWSGSVGYVTEALRTHLSAIGDADFYLAGPPPMVDGTLALLKAAEVSLDRIHFDRFG